MDQIKIFVQAKVKVPVVLKDTFQVYRFNRMVIK